MDESTLDKAAPIEYEPLYDKLLVRLVEGSMQTASGLYMPQSVARGKDKPVVVKVLKVGPGKPVVDMEGRAYAAGQLAPCTMKVGEYGLLASWGGHENLPFLPPDHIIIRDGDILARLHNVEEAEAAQDGPTKVDIYD